MYESPSPDQWHGMLRAATEWLLDLERRGCRVSVVVDPSGMGNADVVARTAAGHWRADHLPLIANTCRCAGYVADSSVMRGVLQAVFWFARPAIPVQIFGSREQALDWVQIQGPAQPSDRSAQ